MKNLISCMGYMGYFSMKAKLAIHKFVTNERGDVNVVAIVVLIAVAVVLALLLKNQIAGLITTLFGNITNKANEALNDA